MAVCVLVFKIIAIVIGSESNIKQMSYLIRYSMCESDDNVLIQFTSFTSSERQVKQVMSVITAADIIALSNMNSMIDLLRGLMPLLEWVH